jgi:hypothetical protein
VRSLSRYKNHRVAPSWIVVLLVASFTGVLLTPPASVAEELASPSALYVDVHAQDSLEDLVTENGDLLGGVVFDSSHTATVFTAPQRTGGQERVLEWGAAHPPTTDDPDLEPWRVVFAEGRASYSELAAARRYLQAEDTKRDFVAEHYIDPIRGVLVASLRHPDDPRVPDLRERFGALVSFEQYEGGTTTRTATRVDDSPAYSGGIKLSPPGCTSGFAVNGTAPQILTAGHCGPVYTNNYNNGTYIGHVVQSVFVDHGYDAARIAGTSYGPAVYAGGPNSSTIRLVHSYVGSTVGQTLCYSGAYNGEGCGATIDVTDVCFDFGTSIETCHMAKTSSPNQFVGPGDSGGPVYRYRTSSTVYAMGLILGIDNTTGGQRAYYVPISRVLTLFSLTLMTTS